MLTHTIILSFFHFLILIIIITSTSMSIITSIGTVPVLVPVQALLGHRLLVLVSVLVPVRMLVRMLVPPSTIVITRTND